MVEVLGTPQLVDGREVLLQVVRHVVEELVLVDGAVGTLPICRPL
jgi:hypothetical protein